ncbi:MAG: hypothetical protein KIS66_09115 [Fimbriimonadaceae bacterium]|nr:hypothetical protein [Fimbriimonadaceae bacterium]
MVGLALCAAVSLAEIRTIENDVLRVGVNLQRGGAITLLQRKNGPNMVNDHDLGRQIQMSYYSGPVPFEPDGKKAEPFWRGLGWNPIQSGDFFGNSSKVLALKVEPTKLYVKCVPMHWPLPNVPGECTFESWIELDGPTVRLRQRLVNRRPDTTPYPARAQELPAVYVNAPWHRLITYVGDAPFTGAPTSEIPKHEWGKDGPWTSFFTSESWAALVDDQGDGLGVWAPDTYTLSGGFVGTPGVGGPKDAPTGYLAPNRVEILDHNIAYESRCVLIVGSVAEIRSYVRRRQRNPPRPQWVFRKDRQHWSYANATDQGWPIPGYLDVNLDGTDPQMIGPEAFWRAADAPVLEVDAAFRTSDTIAEVFWSRTDAPGFAPERRLTFPIVGDGKRRTYRVRLAGHPEYRGALRQIRIDPVFGGRPGDRVRVWRIGSAR